MTSTGQHDESAHPRQGDGKFATKALVEAEVSLETSPEVSDTPHEPGNSHDMVKAARLFNDVQDLTRRLVDAVEERSMVDEVLKENPDVAFIVLRGYDVGRDEFDEHGRDAWMEFRDVHEEPMPGGGVAPFRPAALDDQEEPYGYLIDVQETVERDFDAIRVQTESNLLKRIGGESLARAYDDVRRVTMENLDEIAGVVVALKDPEEVPSPEDYDAVCAEIVDFAFNANTGQIVRTADHTSDACGLGKFKHQVNARSRAARSR